MTFKWECMSYELIYCKEVNKPVALLAKYIDGKTEKKCRVTFENRHLDQAIYNLQVQLGKPNADPAVDDF